MSRQNREVQSVHHFDAALINPLVALIAGIIILLVPRMLNFIVAIYLIIIGILGLANRF
jgi:Protein of unknown function (DUF3096)